MKTGDITGFWSLDYSENDFGFDFDLLIWSEMEIFDPYTSMFESWSIHICVWMVWAPKL